MSKYLHNSPLFIKLDNSMYDYRDEMVGQRNSNYMYHLNAKADGYICNIFFSPQPQVLLSRILAAKPKDLENTKIDLTFATDMSAQNFDDLEFSTSNPKEMDEITSILLNLTVSVNFHNNWKYTVDYSKLVRLLNQNTDNDKLLRTMDTIYSASHDMSKIVKTVVKSLGLKKAKEIIPKAYRITNLANFWFNSLKSVKTELDKDGMSHEQFNNMNFGNRSKKLERFTK